MTDKTIADVLDKSIDKLSGGAAEVAKAVKSMAPHAWEVAVRQQVVEGWTGVASAAVFAVLCVVALVWIARQRDVDWDEPNRKNLTILAGGFCAFVLAVTVLTSWRKPVLQIGNPEYYAALAILQAAK